jgi:hypothetical protein
MDELIEMGLQLMILTLERERERETGEGEVQNRKRKVGRKLSILLPLKKRDIQLAVKSYLSKTCTVSVVHNSK